MQKRDFSWLAFLFQLIAEIIVKLMGERDGLDGAGQAALRRVFDVVIGDIDGYYKEIGYAG